MRSIKCEVCGSPYIVKQGAFFTCQACGCKYTPEQVRNLVGVVVDKEDDYQASYKSGMKALENEDWRSASNFFKMALDAKPSDAKAFHRYRYCSDMSYLHSGSGMTRVKNLVNGFAQKFATAIDIYCDVNGQYAKENGLCEAIHDFSRLANELGEIINKKQEDNNEYGGDTEELYRSYFEKLDSGFTGVKERLTKHFEDLDCAPVQAVIQEQDEFRSRFASWLGYSYSSSSHSGTSGYLSRSFSGLSGFHGVLAEEIVFNIMLVLAFVASAAFVVFGVQAIRDSREFAQIVLLFFIAASCLSTGIIYAKYKSNYGDPFDYKETIVPLVNCIFQIALMYFIIWGFGIQLELIWRILIGFALMVVGYIVTLKIVDIIY